MKRAYGYVRVSTQEQKNHGISVDSQIAAITQYCSDNGIELVKIFNDAGISARKSYKKRPDLLNMIKGCQNGDADLVLFTKLDRFFRSVSDYYECIGQMNNVPWRAIWEDYETETSTGIFKVNIMLSVAQSEADRTSDRLKAINEYRRARGDYVGQAGVGYRTDHGKLLKSDDENVQNGVRAFFQDYLDYKPLKECILHANSFGLSIRRNTAYHMLRSTTYAGDAFGFACEPYITQSEHEKILKRLAEGARTQTVQHRTFIFQGLCHCGYCGRLMASTARKRYSVKRGEYEQRVYQCRNTVGDYVTPPCCGCGINEDVLENIIIESIDNTMRQYNENIDVYYNSSHVQDNEALRSKLTVKLQRIGERYEDGDIDRDTYRAKRDDIKRQLSLINCNPILEKKSMPDGWLDMYKDLDIENKRIFWTRSIKDIKIYKDRKVDIVV